MKDGDLIKFDITKNFKYLRAIGHGGAGETHLLLDETTNTLFAFKKYAPQNFGNTPAMYQRFVDEIKILFKIQHPSIVRIYNYYLYPDKTVGYLQMEFIDGVTIDQYVANESKDWNDIFRETISAFLYLEKNRILHRDIREENIMITNMNDVKIIDFGFGKFLNNSIIEENSIILNWRAPELPQELKESEEYSISTEIFYLGWLFTRLTKDVSNFKYNSILESMTKINTKERILSFSSILDEVNSTLTYQPNFNSQQKETFLLFANTLQSVISKFNEPLSMFDSVEDIIDNLSNLMKKSSLETFIQGNNLLVDCFIKNKYSYYLNHKIEVDIVRDFQTMLVKLPSDLANIVYDHLKHRLSTTKIDFFSDEDIPF